MRSLLSLFPHARLGALALLCGCALSVHAQEVSAPDYREIRANTMNRGTNYFPNLMQRYLENDTTLTLEQYRNLYYGYTLQEDFVPYKPEPKALFDARRDLIKYEGNAATSRNAIKVSLEALDDDPFDLLAISTLTFAYGQLRDTLNSRLWNDKQNSILDAIVSSGDGAEPSTAIHVTNLEHEYEVLNRMGLLVEEDSICNDHIEMLRVRNNVFGIHGIFFNFGACRDMYHKKYE